MNLKEEVLSGLKWATAAKMIGQLFTWTMTIQVIRLLSPGDYGLMAMATVATSFLALAAELGLGTALVQAREVSREETRRILGASILVNLAICALFFASASQLAGVFREPRLAPVVQALSVQFIFSAIATVPESLLRRDLAFRTLALIEMASGLAASVTTLALAALGFGVWSLVLGALAGSGSRCSIFLWLSPERMTPRFSVRGIRHLVSFGSTLTAARLLWYVQSQSDVTILGRILGKDALGVYSVAMHLSSMPAQKAMSIINSVAFSAFARLQADRAAVARNLLRAFRCIAHFSLSTLWGLALVAPELVRVLFGPAWESSVIPLQILSVIGPLRMFSALLCTSCSAVGRPDIEMRNVGIGAIAMPLGFLFAVEWGIVGVATAWAVGVPVLLTRLTWRALPILGITAADLSRVIFAPLTAAAVMVATVTTCRAVLSVFFPPVAALLVLASAGAASYTLVALVIDKEFLLDLREIVGSTKTLEG